jgi:hypothetical protein
MKGYAKIVGITSKNFDSIFEAAALAGAKQIGAFLSEYKDTANH